MSRYATVETEFKDTLSLLDALVETGGWKKECIEIHNIPQNLHGYKGDKRQETANIIIRRQHIGRASNDIGFVKKENGHFSAVISEFDSRKFNEEWIGRLKGNYAFHKIKREMEYRGRNVSRERLINGRQRITVTGYR